MNDSSEFQEKSSEANTSLDSELKSSRKYKKVERDILEDLFNDTYKHRGKIYKVNFFRGIFFGLGTFLGGTVIVAIVVFILTWLASLLPTDTTILDWLIDILRK